MRLKTLIEPPTLLFFFLFLLLLLFGNLTDPDYYWLLKTGELIFKNGALPQTDPFSYTFNGEPLVLHTWLFQLLLYLVHTWGGDWGVKLMTAVLSLAPLIIIYRTAKSLGSRPMSAALIVFFCAVPIAAFVAPRPQLFTYIFFSVYLHLLLQMKYQKRCEQLWVMPLIMLFWVNLHGGYLIGIALLFLYFICELATLWLQGRQHQHDDWQPLKRLLFATLGTIALSAANPNFVAQWLYPFQVITMEASRNYISEWQSINFHNNNALYALAIIAIFVQLNLLRDNRPDLTETVLPAFFIVNGMVSYRHMPFALLLLMLFIVIATRNGAWRRVVTSPAGDIYRARIASGREMGRLQPVANTALVFLLLAGLLAYYPVYALQQQKLQDRIIPVKAADFVIDNDISGRMFNTYRFGGYLIYRLYPREHVFIDGRASLYGDSFFRDYRHINGGAADWRQLFEQYAIDYVICDREAPIRQVLLAGGTFSLVYDDDFNSVLVRNIPRFASLIREHSIAQ